MKQTKNRQANSQIPLLLWGVLPGTPFLVAILLRGSDIPSIV